MKKSDFYFDLPEELIAQTPLEKRDSSRLLHLDRHSGEIVHEHFFDIKKHLRPGDCLVLNDSRVMPARLYGRRSTGAALRLCCFVIWAMVNGNALQDLGKRHVPARKYISEMMN